MFILFIILFIYFFINWFIKEDERLHACMADLQQNGVKFFVSSVAMAGSQWKCISLMKLQNATIILNKQSFVIPGSFFLIEVSLRKGRKWSF